MNPAPWPRERSRLVVPASVLEVDGLSEEAETDISHGRRSLPKKAGNMRNTLISVAAAALVISSWGLGHSQAGISHASGTLLSSNEMRSTQGGFGSGQVCTLSVCSGPGGCQGYNCEVAYPHNQCQSGTGNCPQATGGPILCGEVGYFDGINCTGNLIGYDDSYDPAACDGTGITTNPKC